MAADLLINKNPNLSTTVYFSMNKARVKRSGRQISQDVAEICHFAESGEICQRSCVDSTIQSPKTYSCFYGEHGWKQGICGLSKVASEGFGNLFECPILFFCDRFDNFEIVAKDSKF